MPSWARSSRPPGSACWGCRQWRRRRIRCRSATSASAFDPPPLPEPRYGLKAPASPPTQVRIVPAADGTALYTETWLPAPKDGSCPAGAGAGGRPLHALRGEERVRVRRAHRSWLVPRGYAVTIAHVRGSGGSGGCIEQTAEHEVDDGARVIEDAGELAPWSSGAVGMYGISYPGGTQLATATGPDRERLESLKAIVVGAPVASAYEFYNHDGVPQLGHAVGGAGTYFLQASNPLDSPRAPARAPGLPTGRARRVRCRPTGATRPSTRRATTRGTSTGSRPRR